MKILVVAWIDAANLSIENIVRRMLERGHQVDIYVFRTDYKSIRMFEHLPVTIYPVSKLSKESAQDYDIAFTVDSAMRALRFMDIYVFAYNYVPDTWVSEGPDFMFTMVNDRKLEFEEECAMMPVGCAKNDKEIANDRYKKQILYIDAGHNPFGKNAKTQVANMILEVCKKLPDYKIVIKPRWLPSERIGQAHRSGLHIYDVLNEVTNSKLPANLIMLEEHRDLQELIDESESIITTSVSSYLDAALRKKGCIIVNGFDSDEGYDTRPSIANAYENAEGSGCCVNYQEVTNYLPKGIMCNEEHLIERIPYLNGVSDRIINVMEFVYQSFIAKGLYPDIKKYNYETYQEKMTSSQKITLEDLKTKRFKNGALIIMRFQEHVKANIDKSCLYKKICSDYVKYSMDEKGYQNFLDDMEYERKLICIHHEALMQTDDIDQSIYFQALYDTGHEDEFLMMDASEVICAASYNYYLGMIHAKYNQTYIAIEKFTLFLEEVLGRTYDKYPQESNWGIGNAFNYVFRNFDDYNIAPERLAYLCVMLSKRDITIVDYNNRKRVYNYLPLLAQKIEKEHPQLAYQCLALYAEKLHHYLIREKDNRINENIAETNHIKGSVSYKLGRVLTFPMRFIRRNLKHFKRNGIKNTAAGLVERLRNVYHAQHIYTIWQVFDKKVLKGYDIYSTYVKKYGIKTHLYLSATSRGDAYILGSYFHAFLEKEGQPECPVFVVWNKGSAKIANLFHIENIETVDTEEFQSLINLFMFNYNIELNVRLLHYHSFYRHTGSLGFAMGLHGFNLLSISVAALGVSEDCADKPVFAYAEKELEKIFNDNNLIEGKTVVLSPYAKTVRAIPMTFWVKLVDNLKRNGFIPCTNVAGDEKALSGTEPVFIPFCQSVPFLEKAGTSIGIRSGFQDVTCTANCLKISIMWGKLPTPYRCCSVDEAFCLKDMYHRQDQFDLIYDFEQEEQLIKDIVEMVIAHYSNTAIEKENAI